MKHRKSTKNHAEAALVAKTYGKDWYKVQCTVSIPTALSVLSECTGSVDVFVFPGGASMRVVDATGQPVVLTVMGGDVAKALIERLDKPGRQGMVSILQHARAYRAETLLCLKHLDGMSHCKMDAKYHPMSSSEYVAFCAQRAQVSVEFQAAIDRTVFPAAVEYA